MEGSAGREQQCGEGFRDIRGWINCKGCGFQCQSGGEFGKHVREIERRVAQEEQRVLERKIVQATEIGKLAGNSGSVVKMADIHSGGIVPAVHPVLTSLPVAAVHTTIMPSTSQQLLQQQLHQQQIVFQQHQQMLLLKQQQQTLPFMHQQQQLAQHGVSDRDRKIALLEQELKVQKMLIEVERREVMLKEQARCFSVEVNRHNMEQSRMFRSGMLPPGVVSSYAGIQLGCEGREAEVEQKGEHTFIAAGGYVQPVAGYIGGTAVVGMKGMLNVEAAGGQIIEQDAVRQNYGAAVNQIGLEAGEQNIMTAVEHSDRPAQVGQNRVGIIGVPTDGQSGVKVSEKEKLDRMFQHMEKARKEELDKAEIRKLNRQSSDKGGGEVMTSLMSKKKDPTRTAGLIRRVVEMTEMGVGVTERYEASAVSDSLDCFYSAKRADGGRLKNALFEEGAKLYGAKEEIDVTVQEQLQIMNEIELLNEEKRKQEEMNLKLISTMSLGGREDHLADSCTSSAVAGENWPSIKSFSAGSGQLDEGCETIPQKIARLKETAEKKGMSVNILGERFVSQKIRVAGELEDVKQNTAISLEKKKVKKNDQLIMKRGRVRDFSSDMEEERKRVTEKLKQRIASQECQQRGGSDKRNNKREQ